MKSLLIAAETDASIVAYMVKHLINRQHKIVRDRGGFATLGASAYLDEPEDYPHLAGELNPTMHFLFGAIIKATTMAAADLLGINRARVTYLNDKGLPGFHFFGPLSNGMRGSIHTDEPHKRCSWPCAIVNTYSFTVALEMPHNGGGLDMWAEDADDPVEFPNKSESEFIEYTPGMLYVHSGKRYHRIASQGALLLDDARITLQGHFAELEDGRVVAYF